MTQTDPIVPEVTTSDIEHGLLELGLKSGDVVLMHSSLASFGRVAGGPQAVVDAILNVIGDDGTLVVPTFGDLGILTKVVSQHPRAVNSIHPKASVAAIGKQAKAICKDHWKAELAHGDDTPYVRIADMGGKILLLGVDQDRNTTLHTVEELLRLPYLKQTAAVTFDTPDGEVTRSWPFFPGPHRDFIQNDKRLLEAGIMTVGRIGNSVVRLIQSRAMIDFLVEYGRKHPDWALCDNPHCAACVSQRADLSRSRLKSESFKTAVASSLAGRYVPEMIERMRATGMDYIELDSVQGKPAYLLSKNRLETIRNEFDSAGIGISGLRFPAVIGNEEKLMRKIAESGINRVLIPLNGDVAAISTIAAEYGVTVSFYNIGVGAAYVSTRLLDVKSAGHSCCFTFNPANFAIAGEMPFLKSYKHKLKRFLDQLDIEDATFSGETTSLGYGNAEIREMMSILRCSSFSGWFVLTAANKRLGGLQQACTQFMECLEAM